MVLAKLKSAAAAVLLVGAAVTGTGVLARQFPADFRRADAAGPRPDVRADNPFTATPAAQDEVSAATSSEDPFALSEARSAASPLDVRVDSAVRGPSMQELEIRLKAARRLLNHRENLVRRGTVTPSMVEEARTEVEILDARLEAQRDDLRDELERLEARLLVKQAEQRVIDARLRSVRGTQLGGQVSNIEAELAVKNAEADEVKIRMKQVQRRLERPKSSSATPEDRPGPSRATTPRQ